MKTFEERLEAETAAWVEEGLLSPTQRVHILARHAAPAPGANRFLAILATIGGALLVVGVSLIIKANWEQIGDWVKIGGLVALLVGCHVVGWRLKVAPGRYPKTGDACLMAGAVVFMLGIALVSQIFHLDSRPANGVLLWWVGIAALPWAVRAKGMQFVSVAAWFIWLTMELNAPDSWIALAANRTEWYNRGFLVFGAAFVLLGVVIHFFGSGLRRGRHEDFAGLHESLGVIIASAALYMMGFSWSAYGWYREPLHAARPEAIGFLVALMIAAVAWAGWRRAIVGAIAWPLALALVPVFAVLFGVDLHDASWLWGGIACLAMFVLNIGMIRAGLAAGREGWINFGIAGIAVNIVTRYFLLFGTLLDGGVFFVVSGVLVLGLGFYLERQRRKLVGAVRQEGAS